MPSASAQVVISQLYGGGGNSGATFTHDFVELKNTGLTPVSIDGWSLQYAPATSSTWDGSGGNNLTPLPNVTLQPGQFYLVQMAPGTGGTMPLPTPDHTGLAAMAAGNGKVALVSNAVALSGTCPAGPQIVDLVGYGTANCFEGTAAVPALSNTNAALRKRLGCEDSNDNAADFDVTAAAPRNSTAPAFLCGIPAISITDVALGEGDTGTRTFSFVVQLSEPPGDDVVSFDIATEDGSATEANNDYIGRSESGVTLTGAQTEYIFAVDVVGDSTVEPHETFFVRLGNISGANVLDDEATGTIYNDDGLTITPIHAIQGDGSMSPLAGQSVTTRGVVTGVRSNSFYIQSTPDEADADPATSEGLYIFVNTGNVPPGLSAGDLVLVTGTVVEFVPASDPGQLPITQIGFPDSVITLLQGQPLPPPILLDQPLDPDGGLEQLERYEYMRVRIPEFHVAAPTRPSAPDEYFGVIAGNDRPMREAGVDVHDDPLPEEAPPNVPRWDANPELIRVKSNLLVGGASVPMRAGSVLEELVGVLDYSFRRYTVLTTADSAPVVISEPEGVASTLPLAQDVTIGAFNVENLGGGPGSAGFDLKSGKISTVVREFLHYPDILGIIEVASQETLAAVATKINNDAIGAGDADPQYVAHVLAASGSQRLGFLLRTASVGAAGARVQLQNIEERDLFVDNGNSVLVRAGVLCPDGVTRTIGLLNDRPPLLLEALVAGTNGSLLPLTVINIHPKSLIDVDSRDDASGAYACFNDPLNPGGGEGRRNRAKRQQGAEYLAGIVAELEQTQPGRAIVMVGDFNAFEFNDGYADVFGTLSGVPSPDDETVVPGDGIDFLDPDLIPLVLLMDQQQRYSYTFGGNAQALDHVLVNEGVVDVTTDVRKEFARVNADYHHGDASNPGVPWRSADHDPVQSYLTVSRFFTADLGLDAVLDRDNANFGENISFAVTLDNAGIDAAANPRVVVTLPASTGFVDCGAPAGWSCLPPVSGASGSFACHAASLATGATVQFDFEVELLQEGAGSTAIFQASAEADSTDPNPANNSGADSVVVSKNPVTLPEIFANGFEAAPPPQACRITSSIRR